MGADIYSFVEVKRNNKWEIIKEEIFPSYDSKTSSPFDYRSYSLFGFLADVRNYSHCTPIRECRGLPEDSEYLNSPSPYAYQRNPMSGEPIPLSEQETIKSDILEGGYYGHSWLLLKELLDFDYDQTFWDRRITREEKPNCFNSAALAEEGEGQIITYREHLWEHFFEEIEILKTLGDPENVRIVFWFD